MKNGIRVAADYMPWYESVSFGIWIKAGSVNETSENNGVAHAIEHMVFKRTANRSAKDIADDMTEIGGNIDAFTTKEYTCFYAKTLKEHLFPAVDIISDMLTDSLFLQEDLDKELGVICEEIDMYDDSPEDIVNEQLACRIWRDHPLGFQISGSKKKVSTFKRDILLDFMKSYYTSDRIVISIAGNFDIEETLKVLEKDFEKIPAGPDTVREVPVPYYYPSLYTQHRDIEQIHMVMAFESGSYYSSDRYILAVISSLLGGNVNSRLFQQIREEMGLAYYIECESVAYEKAGLFSVYAAVHPENLKSVVKRVREIIEDMKVNPVDERELYICKQQIRTDLILSEESTYNRMSHMGKTMLRGDKFVSLRDTADRIAAVSGEDILNYMQNHFDMAKMSLSLVGDLKSFEQPEIEALLK